MAKARRQKDPLGSLRSDLAESIRPYYLFHGDNQYFVSEAVRFLREKIVPEGGEDFSYEDRRLDSRSDWADIEALLRSYSFFGGKKLIRLEVPGKLDEETRAALAKFLSEEPGQNILCLTAPNLDQLTAARNRLQKKGGLAIKFEALQERELATWAAEHLRSLGLDFERSVPDLLVESLPGDPGEIASEVEKLRLMVSAEKPIGAADVSRLVGRQRIEDVWKLADSLRAGNEAEAMRRLRELLDAGGQNPIALVGALCYTITMLLRARLLLDQGLSGSAAAAALPLWGGRARDYVQRASSFRKRELLVWVFNLQKLDYRLKRSSAERAGPLMESTLLESMAGRYLPS